MLGIKKQIELLHVIVLLQYGSDITKETKMDEVRNTQRC